MHRARLHQEFSPTSSRQRRRPAEGAGQGGEPSRPSTLAFSDQEWNELRDGLVSDFVMIGSLISMLLPHTGITLVSRSVDHEMLVNGPDGRPLRDKGKQVTVQRRGIATILIGYARRDERIARGVLAFHRLCSAQDELQIAAELGAAVAVDTGRVDPHKGVQVPGTPIRLSPELLIPDVIAQVDAMREAEAREAAEDATSPPAPEHPRESDDGVVVGMRAKPEPDVEVISGGVEAT